MKNEKIIKVMTEAGIANEWHKGDMHRLYIDLSKANDLYMDHEDREHGQLPMNRHDRMTGKCWIDLETGEISAKNLSDAEGVIACIEELAELLAPTTTTEETVEESAEETEAESKIWYAVLCDSEDNDWGYGSFDPDEAKAMALELRQQGRPDAYIAVIDNGIDPTCIDEIYDLED